MTFARVSKVTTKRCQLLCISCLGKVTYFSENSMESFCGFLSWFHFVSLFFFHLDLREGEGEEKRTFHRIRKSSIWCPWRCRKLCLGNEWWSPKSIFCQLGNVFLITSEYSFWNDEFCLRRCVISRGGRKIGLVVSCCDKTTENT